MLERNTRKMPRAMNFYTLIYREAKKKGARSKLRGGRINKRAKSFLINTNESARIRRPITAREYMYFYHESTRCSSSSSSSLARVQAGKAHDILITQTNFAPRERARACVTAE